MNGPSNEALTSHHLTEAIKHLYAAAAFVREIDHDDAKALAATLEGAAETAREIRVEIAP